jgi:hypothetical protein
MLLPLALSAGSLGLAGLNARQLKTRVPGATPASAAEDDLIDALEARVNQIAPDKTIEGLDIRRNTPPEKEGMLAYLRNSGDFASSSRAKDPGDYIVNINPNADRALLAHELGHIASDQTKVGNMIRSARSNPKLTKALAAAALLGGGATAAMTPGDEDLATSVALSYAAAAPTLVDEALANKNALAIMQSANMTATPLQRGRLAGGYLTYLGAPLLAGAVANQVGNYFDQDMSDYTG